MLIQEDILCLRHPNPRTFADFFFFLHSVIVCFYLYMEHPWLLVKRQFSEKVKMMVHIYIKVNTISFNALFMRKPGRCYIRLERSQRYTNVYGIKGY